MMARESVKRTAFFVSAIVLLLAVVAIARRRTASAPKPESVTRYAAPGACKACHSAIAASYAELGMGRSFYRPSAGTAVEDYSTKNEIFHAPSRRHYRMTSRDGKFVQRRYQTDERGREVNVFEREVSYIIGSGNHARSYLHLSPSGELTQLPVTWYTVEKRWGMSPGYDKQRHFDFTRGIDHGCFFCHNAYPELPAGGDRYGANPIFPARLPEGIDCQRCHGPGGRHVELASSGKAVVDAVRAAIVNPARLPADLRLDVCLQCHLETTSSKLPHALRRFGRSAYSFLPGERLSDFLVQFDHPQGAGYDDKFEINSSGYRLRQSRCFEESAGKLQCTTCHNPHSKPPAAEASAYFRSRCVSCHADAHQQPSGDCISCHMPRRRTDDAIHVIMTDHRIAKPQSGRNLLAMREETEKQYHGDLVLYEHAKLAESERALYLGVAFLADGADRKRGVSMLEEAREGGTPLPIEALVELANAYLGEPALSKAIPLYEQALQRQPDMPKVRYNYARALQMQGLNDRAMAELEQVINVEPHFAEALNTLGLLHMQRGELPRAQYLFESAAAAAPQSAEARNNLGLAQMATGELRAAREQFELAIVADPSSPGAYNNLARLLAQQQDGDGAVRYLEKALEVEPSHLEARYNLARILHEQGKRALAIREYKRAIDQKPGFVEAHVSLGVALAESGRLAEAIKEFESALSLRPDHAVARKNLEQARQLQQ